VSVTPVCHVAHEFITRVSVCLLNGPNTVQSHSWKLNDADVVLNSCVNEFNKIMRIVSV